MKLSESNMSNSIRLKDKVISVKEKTIQEEQINLNTSTGDKDHLYPKLKQSFKTATTIDIIVSFLMESGVKLLLQDLIFIRILKKKKVKKIML